MQTAGMLHKLTFAENGPAMSCTSSFRVNKAGLPIAALKAYPMTPFRDNDQTALRRDVVDYVLHAADLTLA